MEIFDEKLGYMTEKTFNKLKNTQYSLYDIAIKLKETLEYFKQEVNIVPHPHQKYVLECAMRAEYKMYSELYNEE